MRHYHSYITLFFVFFAFALFVACGRREADDAPPAEEIVVQEPRAEDTPHLDAPIEALPQTSQFMTIQGRVQLSSGTPVSGVQVWAQYANIYALNPQILAREQQSPICLAYDVTDDTGAFSLKDIAASRAFVLVCAVESFPALHLGPWFSTNPPPDDIVFVLPDALGRLIGSFTDTLGKPVTNVIITYQQRKPVSKRYRHPLGVKIEEDGSYVTDYLIPGTYSFIFHAPNASSKWCTERVTANGTHLHDVTFTYLPLITGIVMDAATDTPIADVTVVSPTRGEDGIWRSTTNKTDHAGMFFVHLMHGIFTFTHPDYAPVRNYRIMRQRDCTHPEIIYLSRPANVRVIACMSDGTPAKDLRYLDAKITPYRTDQRFFPEHESFFSSFNDQGIAVVSNIPSHLSPLTAEIRFETMSFAKSAPHPLTPHEMQDIYVSLPPLGALSLYLLEPATGSYVEAHSPAFQHRMFFSYENAMHFNMVHTGTHSMNIIIDNVINLHTNITIFQNHTTDFYVDLSASKGRIHGSVFYEDGTPADVRVSIYSNDRKNFISRYIRTHDGLFDLRGLPENTSYDVRLFFRCTNIIVNPVMPDGPPLHITVPQEYRLTGRLQNPDGKAVKARIVCDGQWANANGEFTIYQLIAGTYTLQIFPDGFVPFEKTVTVVENTDLGIITVEEDTGATVRGRIVSPDGAPIRNVRIQCTKRDFAREIFVAETKTSFDGTFVLGGIPPEKSIIVAVHDKYNHPLFRLGPFPSGEHDYGDIILDLHVEE